MPTFFRPIYSQLSVSDAYDRIHSPVIYKCLKYGLGTTIDRVSRSQRKCETKHFKILTLQKDYARYAKKVAKYARENNLSVRPEPDRNIDYRIPELPIHLKEPLNTFNIDQLRSSLEEELTKLESEMASIRKQTDATAADPAFKIFCEVAVTGKLEPTFEMFLRNHYNNDSDENRVWFIDDLSQLYGKLKSWRVCYSRRNELLQLQTCLEEANPSQSIRRNTKNIERQYQIGFTTEALEKMFTKARAE